MHTNVLHLKHRLRNVRISGQDQSAPDAADVRAFRDLLASLGTLVADARSRNQRFKRDLAQTGVELGVAIAERLLGAAIPRDRQRLDALVAECLERLQPGRAVAVLAHPDDLALLQRQLAEHSGPDAWQASLNLHPDITCPRGKLTLEADGLFVEWDTQRSLAELRRLLLDEIFAD